jgi:hypothetical protein
MNIVSAETRYEHNKLQTRSYKELITTRATNGRQRSKWSATCTGNVHMDYTWSKPHNDTTDVLNQLASHASIMQKRTTLAARSAGPPTDEWGESAKFASPLLEDVMRHRESQIQALAEAESEHDLRCAVCDQSANTTMCTNRTPSKVYQTMMPESQQEGTP